MAIDCIVQIFLMNLESTGLEFAPIDMQKSDYLLSYFCIMKNSYTITPSSFIMEHGKEITPKLELGSTVCFDIRDKYNNIPLDTFVRYIHKIYLTRFQNMGTMLVWEIIGFVNDSEPSLSD